MYLLLKRLDIVHRLRLLAGPQASGTKKTLKDTTAAGRPRSPKNGLDDNPGKTETCIKPDYSHNEINPYHGKIIDCNYEIDKCVTKKLEKGVDFSGSSDHTSKSSVHSNTSSANSSTYFSCMSDAQQPNDFIVPEKEGTSDGRDNEESNMTRDLPQGMVFRNVDQHTFDCLDDFPIEFDKDDILFS